MNFLVKYTQIKNICINKFSVSNNEHEKMGMREILLVNHIKVINNEPKYYITTSNETNGRIKLGWLW